LKKFCAQCEWLVKDLYHENNQSRILINDLPSIGPDCSIRNNVVAGIPIMEAASRTLSLLSFRQPLRTAANCVTALLCRNWNAVSRAFIA
jgi:hypothetical protein